VVLGTSLGTHLELGDFGNLMRMRWELHGNIPKTKKSPPPRTPAHTPKKPERRTVSLPN